MNHTISSGLRSGTFGLLLALASASQLLADSVWQWSVPVPSLEGRRAYLWIPPDCQRVRGLVIACQNMLEEPLFERPAFRDACAASGLGEVLIYSGHDKGADDDKDTSHPKRSYLDIFLNPSYPNGPEDPKSAGEDLQKALDALANESGYSEIQFAPILPVGHSSAGSFVWHLYRWDASRIFAMMPFKTGSKDDGPTGIPILDVNSEWFEYGDWPMHNVSLVAPDGGARISGARTHSPDSLYGYYVDIGCGHCNASDDAIPIMRLFMAKAVAARIPDDAPMDGPVNLKPVFTDKGWLLDPETFGKPGSKASSYRDYQGDPNKALWYLDEEMAEAVQNHVAAQLAKKPLQIGIVKDGQPSPDARMISFSPTFIDDAGTFKLSAVYVDHIDHAKFGDHDTAYYPDGTVLDTNGPPISYRVNSGGVVQTGPDTFRICPRDGPLLPQGNPWEPTLVAYSLGDDTYRPAEHPAHVNISIINTAGSSQTIDFRKLSDVESTHLDAIQLHATASSNLPVEFYVASGPATISGNTLTFDKIPARAKYPISVRVAAFQWGRSTNPQVQSAGPVVQEFFIQK